jgi:hypothetical protein
MKYVDTLDGEILNIHQASKKKNVSFHPTTPQDLVMFDVAVLTEEAAPAGDVVSGTQVAEFRGDSKWYRLYDIRSYTVDEKSAIERTWRDAELVSCDIAIYCNEDSHASAILPVSVWRTFRNELRDYPQQGDFPNGTRPTRPS